MSRTNLSIIQDMCEQIVIPALNLISIGLGVVERTRAMYRNYGHLSLDELHENVVYVSSAMIQIMRIGYGILESCKTLYGNN